MDAIIWIIIGGFFEPAWVTCMEKMDRSTEKSQKRMWCILWLIFMFCSLIFLSWGMNSDTNIGIAYAIWTAVGSILTIVLSKIIFKEHISYQKVFAIMLILIGISGLEIAGGL